MKIILILTIFIVVARGQVKIGESFLKAVKTVSDFYEEKEIEERIVGGLPVQLGDIPYQALLLTSVGFSLYITGGSLIKPNWVLTSAAIVGPQVTSTACYLGIVQHNDTFEATSAFAEWWSGPISSSSRFPHPQYDSTTFNNNIGLLKIPLDEATLNSLKYVSVIQLPRESDASVNLVGMRGKASGFGVKETLFLAQELRQVSDLEIITNEECSLSIPAEVLNENVFCTKNTGARSICAGDEGGPLTTMLGGVERQIGVVSFSVTGSGCNQTMPATYIKVSNYLQFIEDTTDSAASIKLSIGLSLAAILLAMLK